MKPIAIEGPGLECVLDSDDSLEAARALYRRALMRYSGSVSGASGGVLQTCRDIGPLPDARLVLGHVVVPSQIS
jgi:hypothetical protein